MFRYWIKTTDEYGKPNRRQLIHRSASGHENTPTVPRILSSVATAEPKETPRGSNIPGSNGTVHNPQDDSVIDNQITVGPDGIRQTPLIVERVECVNVPGGEELKEYLDQVFGRTFESRSPRNRALEFLRACKRWERFASSLA
jgi:hypothetical protein